MTDSGERELSGEALEAAAEAVVQVFRQIAAPNAKTLPDGGMTTTQPVTVDGLIFARAAITAYLDALGSQDERLEVVAKALQACDLYAMIDAAPSKEAFYRALAARALDALDALAPSQQREPT